jgi:MFS transporter, OFA family, oxalate/formate antiporter
LITGIAVGGFGAGALITAPVATRLIQTVGVLHTFAYLGVAYLIVTMIAGAFMQNPPDGWKPEGWSPTATQVSQRAKKDYTLVEALGTWQWWALWLLLFLNTSAGISVISQEAPIFQELARVSAVVAAGMVGIVALGNALGRVFWAWVSDLTTRKITFFVMFLLQAVLFWIFPNLGDAGILAVVTFIVLMCYGGGFGTMPAFHRRSYAGLRCASGAGISPANRRDAASSRCFPWVNRPIARGALGQNCRCGTCMIFGLIFSLVFG